MRYKVGQCFEQDPNHSHSGAIFGIVVEVCGWEMRVCWFWNHLAYCSNKTYKVGNFVPMNNINNSGKWHITC